MRIGVAGIAGRMGRLVAEEVRASGECLAGGVLRPGDAAPPDMKILESIQALAHESDVVVDFTHANATAGHAKAISEAGTAWILGTTGISDAAQHDVAAAASRVAVVQAANFSPGVTTMLRLARLLAKTLPGEDYDAEILEMHHRQKLDAPSGTALALGRAVATGRGVALDAVIESGRHGQTGARRGGAIGFAALRGGQVVGDHTLIFAGSDEQIQLRHTAFDRRVFARGAVTAARWTAGKIPGLYDMNDVLGLL